MTDKINEIRIRKTSANICDLFEDLLEQFDITIPCEDREGDESEARIYGSVYSDLEDEITYILSQLCNTCQNNPSADINTVEY